MRLLTISGSLRAGSYNSLMLDALESLTPDWVQVTRLEGLRQVPAFDQDDEADAAAGLIPAVARLRAAVAAADVVVIATPEYNSSLPGQLKNVLDWISRPVDSNPLRSKPVAALSSSTGQFGGVWAQNELRKVLGALGARVIDEQLALVKADTQFDDTGRLMNPGALASLRGVVAGLAREFSHQDVPAEPSLADAVLRDAESFSAASLRVAG